MVSADESVRPRLARHVRYRFDRVRGQHTLLLPEAILVINPTGAAILELCDGERTIAGIESELRARYDRIADGEVLGYLTDLIARRVIEVNHG